MYSPKIDEELVRALYQIKKQTKLPMTRMVNDAVRSYLAKKHRITEETEVEDEYMVNSSGSSSGNTFDTVLP